MVCAFDKRNAALDLLYTLMGEKATAVSQLIFQLCRHVNIGVASYSGLFHPFTVIFFSKIEKKEPFVFS